MFTLQYLISLDREFFSCFDDQFGNLTCEYNGSVIRLQCYPWFNNKFDRTNKVQISIKADCTEAEFAKAAFEFKKKIIEVLKFKFNKFKNNLACSLDRFKSPKIITAKELVDRLLVKKFPVRKYSTNVFFVSILSPIPMDYNGDIVEDDYKACQDCINAMETYFQEISKQYGITINIVGKELGVLTIHFEVMGPKFYVKNSNEISPIKKAY